MDGEACWNLVSGIARVCVAQNEGEGAALQFIFDLLWPIDADACRALIDHITTDCQLIIKAAQPMTQLALREEVPSSPDVIDEDVTLIIPIMTVVLILVVLFIVMLICILHQYRRVTMMQLTHQLLQETNRQLDDDKRELQQAQAQSNQAQERLLQMQIALKATIDGLEGDRNVFRQQLVTLESALKEREEKSPNQGAAEDLSRYKYHLAYLPCNPLFDNDPAISIRSLSLETELSILRDCLKETRKQIKFAFSHATTHYLSRYLQKGCQILHISGHVFISNMSEPYITFEDDTVPGLSHHFSVSDLRKLVKQLPTPPHLVVLAMCHSEVFAKAFLDAGVKFVIVTDHEILDHRAVDFVRHFYDDLFQGQSVRQSFGAANRRFHSTPLIPGSQQQQPPEPFKLLPASTVDFIVFPSLPIGKYAEMHRRSPDLLSVIPPDCDEYESDVGKVIRELYTNPNQPKVVTVVGSTSNRRRIVSNLAARYLRSRTRQHMLLYDYILSIDLNVESNGTLEERCGKRLQDLFKACRDDNVAVPDATDLHSVITASKLLFVFYAAEHTFKAPPNQSSANSLHKLLAKLVLAAGGSHVIVASLDSLESVDNLSGVSEIVHTVQTVDSYDEKIVEEENKVRLNYRHWHVPRELSGFINRPDLVTLLRRNLTGSVGKKLVTVGMGGIGKTQLTLHYVRSCIEDNYFVAWFYADSADRLHQQFTDFSGGLSTNESLEAVAQVRNWFQSRRGGKWLIVFDNVIDDSRQIMDYLPLTQPADCHILITTRFRGFFTPQFVMTEVQEMSMDEAVHLLSKEAAVSDSPSLRTLVTDLGFLPLAISQAAGYIRHNQISCEEYIRLYNGTSGELLRSRYNIEREELPVYSTWEISVKQLENDYTAQQAQLAMSLLPPTGVQGAGGAVSHRRNRSNIKINPVKLLTACAYLQPDAIPRSLLKKWCRVEDEVMLPLITALMTYSLLQRQEEIMSQRTSEFELPISIHRVLQKVTQVKTSNDLCQSTLTSLLEAGDDLCKKYRLEDRLDLHTAQRVQLLPHLESLIMHYESHFHRPSSHCYHYTICHIIFIHYVDLRNNNQVRHLLRNYNHLVVDGAAQSIFTLPEFGLAYWKVGDLSVAEELLEKARRLQHHRNDDTEFRTLIYLAKVRAEKGEYVKAETNLVTALDIAERKTPPCIAGAAPDLPVNPSELILVWSQLALLKCQMNRVDSARIYAELGRQLVLKLFQRGLHKAKSIAVAIVDLAKCFKRPDDQSRAEDLLRKALTILDLLPGQDKNLTACIQATYARLFHFTNYQNDAGKFFEAALGFVVCGESVSETTLCEVGHMCFVYGNRKGRDASRLLGDALRMQERAFGPSSYKVADTLEMMGNVNLKLGQIHDAIKHLCRARDIQRQHYGQNHRRLVSTMTSLHTAYSHDDNEMIAAAAIQREIDVIKSLTDNNGMATPN